MYVHLSTKRFFDFNEIWLVGRGHVTFNLAETSVVKSRPSVLYGANLLCI